jgi:hypothetical protein
LLAVVPTPRDAGGTVSACVATRVRFAFAVSRALLAALGVFGLTVCCAFEAADVFGDSEAGIGWDGVGEVVARGGGAVGDCDVVG